MTPANEYVRILERNPQDISSLWRILQIFFYFVAAMAGYLGTIFFYTLWQDIFDGQCPLWSSVSAMPHDELEPPNEFDDADDDTYDMEVSNITDWRLNVVISQIYNPYCNIFFIVMICSCAFGVIWLMFFYLSGKGGFDGEIFEDSSRIVIAAFLFSFIFSIFVFYTAHSISDGFAQFSTELDKVFLQLPNITTLRSNDKCTVLQTYIKAYKGNRFDVCKTFMYTKVLVWLMCTSWTAGMILLLVRILTLTDFRFVKVTVYNVPREDLPSTSNGGDKQKNI